jgi:hypothetical protein
MYLPLPLLKAALEELKKGSQPQNSAVFDLEESPDESLKF